MNQPKIVAIAGSTREGSFNKSLIRIAAESARAAGAEVTVADLRDLSLPLFDADFEATDGLPAGARRLKTLLRDSDGMLLASPEYNSSLSGVLKNAIDWASRAESDDEPPLAAFDGKVAAIFSASPGALGGLRGLVHLRAILGNLGVLVLPNQVTIPRAHEVFDSTGAMADDRKREQVGSLVGGLVQTVQKLKS